MKTIYLIANWKMNPTSLKEAEKLIKEVIGGFSKLKNKKDLQIVLCPPFPYLLPTARHLRAGVKLGAQNCYFEDKGPDTGEVSPAMLKDLKCDFVIVGHSERRHKFNEDSVLISKKVKAVLKNKMTPVLAVGEKEGESLQVVTKQLKESLSGIAATQIKNIIIAYEPVWAIGTGNAEAPDDAMSARIFIQKVLSDIYSKKIAESARIIYGGSTNSKNIKTYVREAGMAGALVGGSSLKAKEFLKMVEAVAKNS